MTLLEEIFVEADKPEADDIDNNNNSTGNAFLDPKRLLETLLRNFNPQIVAKLNGTTPIDLNTNLTSGVHEIIHLSNYLLIRYLLNIVRFQMTPFFKTSLRMKTLPSVILRMKVIPLEAMTTINPASNTTFMRGTSMLLSVASVSACS